MVIELKNSTIQFLIKTVYKDKPIAVNFEKRYGDFIDFLETLPKEINTDALSLVEWKKLLFKNSGQAYHELQKETNQDIRFLWVVSSFKIYKLVKAILNLLNEGDFYSCMSLTRTLTEVSCFCNYCLLRIKPFVDEINKNTDNHLKYMEIHQEIEKIITLGKKGTNIDFMINEGTDTTESVSVSKAINFVSQKEKYKSIKPKYSILCNYVHPNIFSNSIFGMPTKFYKDKETKYSDEEKVMLIPGEMDLFVRDTPKEYESIAVTFLGMLISIIYLDMDLFEETVSLAKSMKIELLKQDIFNKLNEKQKEMLLNEFLKEDVKFPKS